MVLAVVWHWWISVALVVGALLFVVGTIVGYINQVVRPQYPRKK